MNDEVKISFAKKPLVKLVLFSLLVFSAFTLFLYFSGYFEISLMSDDFLNFVSAETSTLKQKLTSQIPFYNKLHYRPLWFLSINSIIDINNSLGIEKNNFILFRIENLIYYFIIVFLTSFLTLKVTNRINFAYAVFLLCLIYPNNINDICWTIGKVDLLCGIFTIASLIFVMSYLEKKSNYKQALAVLFFCLGLFTKETAIIIPFVTIGIVFLSFSKDKVIEIKYLIVAEIIILLIYTYLRTYIIGLSATELVTNFQRPGVYSSLSVIYKVAISIIIPYDYIVLQENLLTGDKVFLFYLVALIVFLITVIFIFVRTSSYKYIFYLLLIFLISIAPNLYAGYFRPQLTLIPFLLFYTSLFIALSKVTYNLRFLKIALVIALVFYAYLSYKSIQDWRYASGVLEKKLQVFLDLDLNKDRKNIILGLPGRYNQAHLLEYSMGAYNYGKYGEFKVEDKFYDIIYTGALDSASLNSEISVKKLSDTEYDLKISGDTQYFLKLDGNLNKYKDEDVIIKLSERNPFRKNTRMYIKLLSDKADLYILSGDKFIKINQ